MRLARLGRMSLGELALRGRQEATKWLERMGPIPSRDARHPLAPGSSLRRPDFDVFFPGATDERVAELLAARLPEARDAILSSASAILDGSFDLLGYTGLRFGSPIDWQLDPVSGRRAPSIHWSGLDPLDPQQVGDSKVVWELGRMQWLVTLGQAYRLTEAERCATAFVAAARGFIRANPPGHGIQWASSLECALRIVSWTWALALFDGAPAVGREVVAEIVASLEDHAQHVERYLSVSFSPNTHLTGEALGLLYAGLLLPASPRADRWRARGLAILVEESGRQILPDGIYFEQATCYQRYTAEIGLHLLILARRSGLAVPEEVGARFERLLDALLALRRPDGGLPSIGDADGGWLLPTTGRPPDDVRGVFALAAVLFSRPDFAWAAGGLAAEVLWFLGADGAASFDALTPAPPARQPSRLFADGGYAVTASGWDARAHHMILDVGPLGCPISGAHGHADLLSVQCAAFGEPYVVDPGTCVYTGDRLWRDHFRGTSAHSTVVVDGVAQAEPAGPFAWRSRPSATLRRWLSTGAFDFADAEHDAFGKPGAAFVHRRRVLFVKPRYWVLADDVWGAGRHRVEVRFQLAPLRVSIDPWPWVRVHGAAGRGLLLRSFASVPLEVEVHEGETTPIQGWFSADYGQRQPAPVVVQAATGCLPLRILTLLLPVEDVAAAPPQFEALPAEGAGPAGIALMQGGEPRESVVFGERDVLVERAQEEP